jgi:NTE family protein
MSPATEGKIGLALSGGGFRAAFFHVGVLARLAELRILPRIEVISTVSGGSIVGAAYYLVLKNRMEAEHKGPLEDAEYVELVHQVEEKLLAAVRKNLRGRLFANPWKTVKMAWPSYSRSDRIGDLYDRYLYKPIWKDGPNGERPRVWRVGRRSFGRETRIAMHELHIRPKIPMDGEPPVFWINATSLNSGHNWRFGTLRMGESKPKEEKKRGVVDDVDKNLWFDRGVYDKGDGSPWVGAPQARFPLALAVAASACVPVLFHPLSISRVYGGYRVELVDGGVQDNQGIQGLLDEECENLIVSDASGQMDDKEKPATLVPSVAGRTMSISGDRIRDEQLTQARAGEKRMALLHLRKGLKADLVEPVMPRATIKTERRRGIYGSSRFRVNEKVQSALSEIRTDLDYFGDSEAFSLMLDGYLMSDYELAHGELRSVRGRRAPRKNLGDWDFGQPGLPDRLREEPTGKYRRQLDAGKHRFLRTIALFWPWPVWRFIALLVAVAAAVAAAFWGGAIGDAISDVWEDHWSAWAVIVAIGSVLVLLIAYLATAIQWWLIRYGLAILWGLLLIIPAIILFVFTWVALFAGRLLRPLGKVPGPA